MVTFRLRPSSRFLPFFLFFWQTVAVVDSFFVNSVFDSQLSIFSLKIELTVLFIYL